MELIPIIKLALIIFATVVFFIVLISYMIYKAKEKKTVQPWNKNNDKNNIGKSHSVHVHGGRNMNRDNYSDMGNRDQLYFIPQRETRKVPVLAHVEPRSRERFKIVNEQPVNYRIYQTRIEKPRAFYHPGEQAINSFSFPAPAGNILDSYSLSNEPLRKLAIK